MPVALHYEREGTGHPVLLLHGGELSSASHRTTRTELAKYFDVITPDTRGHGQSPDADEPMTYQNMALDVIALLDRLQIHKTHVLGFSDGAVVGLELAINHPTRIDRLIVLGGNYLPEGLTDEAREKIKTHQNPKLKNLWLNEPNYTEDQLSKIKTPTLIAAGDRDVIKLEHLIAMYRAIPGAELCILPGATHFVLWEKPEEAHAPLIDFLRRARKKPKPQKALDAIVVGTGGVGSAALYHLASRGAEVLGIDRFPPGHARGSSHGDTRVIRLAYFENPNYVPLLRRAYELWDELSARANRDLIHRIGLIQVGSEQFVEKLESCAKLHNLEIETFDGHDLEKRYPGFRAGEHDRVIYEKIGGYLDVEDCVLAHAAQATAAGARLQIGEEVKSISATATQVTVITDRAEYRAAKVVVSPGPWATDLLSGLNVGFNVLRQPLFWYDAVSSDYDQKNGAPIFLYDTPKGIYYGLPKIDVRGLKIAQHLGGDRVEDPLNPDRTLHAAEVLRIEEFMREHLPGVGGNLSGHTVCMYTMSPDENFVVGAHPEFKNIVFAAGLSGHGFKFTAVLGEILADLTLSGRTALPIDFLSPVRFK
jgi:sarcosine oxidase